jgi:hypothetical protein
MATIRDRYIIDIDTSSSIRSLNDTSAAVGRIDSSLRGIRGAVGVAAGALATIGAGAFISNVSEATAEFQDLMTTLETVTGSVDNARDAFGFIQDFATTTPFGVNDLTEAYIRLQNAGIAPTEQLLNTLGDAAAVSGDKVGALEAITQLFARSVQGGLGLEDLDRLADRGINVYGILREELGLTRQDISEFGKTAEGAAEIQEALLRGFEREYGGGMARAADNLSTSLSNLGIAANNSLIAVGEGGLSDGLQYAAEAITRLLGDNTDLAESLGSFLGQAIITATDAVVGFVEIMDQASPILELVGTIVSDIIFPALQAFFNILVSLSEALLPIVESLIPAFQSGLEFVQTAIQGTIEFIERMIERLGALWDTAREIAGGVGDSFRDMRDSASARASELSDNVTGFFGDMYDKVVGNSIVPDMVQGVLSQFGIMNQGMSQETAGAVGAVINNFSTVGSVLDSVSNSVGSAAGVMTSSLSGLFNINAQNSPLFSGLQQIGRAIQGVTGQAGGLTNALGNIGGIINTASNIGNLFAGFFADGGFIPRGQFGVVGERGPEIVSGPAQVTPLGMAGVTYNINAVDVNSFQNLLARDPSYLHALVQKGSRSIPGGRR